MSVWSFERLPLGAPPPRPAPDRKTRRRPTESGAAARALPTEIGFLVEDGVPPELLRHAAKLARRQGVFADETLIAEGYVTEVAFYRALAAHLRVAFLDDFRLSDPAFDSGGAHWARLETRSDGVDWLLAPRGAALAPLIGATRAARGRCALTTPSCLTQARRAQETRPASLFPSARARTIRRRHVAIAAAVTMLPPLALLSPLAPVVAPAVATLFLAGVLLRLIACACSREKTSALAPTIADADLPVYTVVVALYREEAVARQLTRALDNLDYPRAKLDIKFMVEADDVATADALRRWPPHAPHEIVVVPPGGPRTKPNALDAAMPLARGTLATVLDAEDLPRAGQLRSAAAIFAQSPPTLGALQASLVIDNGADTPLTGLFALDYAALFDVFNPGLAQMRLPLFLGGTSNHFRLEALRAVGFWDPWNVTEDADLGLRLARAGFDVDTFPAQTLEEAPLTFETLLRQRSRWMKGWMQTAIAHLSTPRAFCHDLGPRRALAVVALFASALMGPLLGPWFAGVFLYDCLFGRLLSPQGLLEVATTTLYCCTALYGVAALLGPLVIGARRRGLHALLPRLLWLPVWLAMLSLAAWRGAFELWLRPFHWEKTQHGLARRSASVYADGYGRRREELADAEDALAGRHRRGA